MWLAVHLPPEIQERAEREFFYETLLGISPDVYCGPATYEQRKEFDDKQQEIALVFLGTVTKYWKLSSLTSNPKKSNNDKQQKSGTGPLPSFETLLEGSVPQISPSDPLYKFLKKLSLVWPPSYKKKSKTVPGYLHFVISPQPYYSHAILSISQELSCYSQKFQLSAFQSLYYYSKEALADFFMPLPITTLSKLIPDLLKKSESRSQMEYFFECAHELGLYKLYDIAKITASPQDHALFLERFGPTVSLALKRLQCSGKSPALKRYTAPEKITYSFSPLFEKDSSSEAETSLIDRFLEIFSRWEDLLKMQKKSLRGLQVIIKPYLQPQSQTFLFQFARPLRKATHLLKILQEKLFSASSLNPNTTHIVYDNIEHISLTSMGTEDSADKQLDLFNPDQERILEDWSLVITEALGTHKNTRIGYYQAFESYFPENSIEWCTWDSAQDFLPAVEDHPPRPQWIFEKPRPYTKKSFLSESEFLNYIQQKSALSSLERLRDPWKNLERTYAQVEWDWIFWEHIQNQCFWHGIFEPAQNILDTDEGHTHD